MSILFLEGMPRSGKSFTCVSRYIAEALRNGRPVDAFVDGLDHEKIAPLVGLSVERCKELLVYVPEDQVMRMPYIVRDNALVVIDEAQDFFPSQRKPLDQDWTKLVTQHGHRGLDIILMGQVFNDVHKLWRGRVKTKTVFTKLDAVGFENKFNAKTFTAPSAEKFVLVSDEVQSYDTAWFGTYKSHTGDNIQTGNFKEKRASILGSSFARFTVPLAIVAALAGGWVLYRFFSGDAFKKESAQAKADPAARRPGAAPAKPAPPPAAKPVKPSTFVGTLNASYRPRLAGWTGPHDGRAVDGVIEWYDGEAVRERLTFAQIRLLGSSVRAQAGIAVVEEVRVTHWPLPERAAVPTAVSIPGVTP